MISIKLVPKADVGTILPLLRTLNDKIEEATLVSRLDAMVEDHGYECVGIYDNDILIGISGLWILTKYYVGKHIEPDNVVIQENYRDRGLGEQLMEWIYAYGKSKGCVASELNCYVQNSGGNRFWHKQGYRIVAFHYQKALE